MQNPLNLSSLSLSLTLRSHKSSPAQASDTNFMSPTQAATPLIRLSCRTSAGTNVYNHAAVAAAAAAATAPWSVGECCCCRCCCWKRKRPKTECKLSSPLLTLIIIHLASNKSCYCECKILLLEVSLASTLSPSRKWLQQLGLQVP